MNISEMHVWFRQYAQQMGMQNVRAILPEQIDLLINTSITDTVNQIISQNIGTTNDRVITDNSKIGQINALRSLYKVIEVDATIQQAPNYGTPFIQGDETRIQHLIGELDYFTEEGFNDRFMFLVDFSINYKKPSSTSSLNVTNYFPIRLIDDIFLADTLNDFILAPRLRSPIAVIYNDKLDIYTDEKVGNTLKLGLLPYKVRVSYIAKPAKVEYLNDLNSANVNCDLPEHMHVDILKHAVDLYRIAVSGSLSNAQQQAQAQQQEDARNNYRNEGNQR